MAVSILEEPTSPSTPGSLTIVTDSFLPYGAVNAPYFVALEATGGVEPYTWSVVAGALPTGLYLDAATGEISGIPATAGTFNFTIQVMDASNQAVTKPFAVSPPLPSGSASSSYTTPIVINDPGGGNTSCSSYAVIAGSLPDGLTLDPATGITNRNAITTLK